MTERFLKRVLYHLAEPHVLEGLKEYVIERLEPMTPDDLYLAIKEDKSLWSALDERDRRRIRRWGRILREHDLERRVTVGKLTKVIITWLSDERPDLASVILNLPAGVGMKWLEKRVARPLHRGLFA